MELNEYQRKASVTVLDTVRNDDSYMFLGLVSEVGELASLRKRERRDHTMAHPQMVKAELGDILWYLSQVAGCYGFSLEEIADYNLCKLAARAANGTLSGAGDSR